MFGTFTDRIIASIITIGSLFFPFIDGIEPVFTNVNLVRGESALVLSMYLENCYTDDLDKILMSGQPVTLQFSADLYDKAQTRPIMSKQFHHRLRYNPLEKRYQMYLSETGATEYFTTIQDVHKNFSAIDGLKIVTPSDIEKNHRYFIRLSAHLEPITFIGQDSDLDLMLFWNNKRPVVSTEVFDISIFYH